MPEFICSMGQIIKTSMADVLSVAIKKDKLIDKLGG